MDLIRQRCANGPLFALPDVMSQRAKRVDPIESCRRYEFLLGELVNEVDITAFNQKVDSLYEGVSVLGQKHFDEAFAFLVLSDGENYPVAHQLHTGLLVANLLPKIDRVPPHQRRGCILGALTMNVGMLELQAVLLNQKVPLTPDQKEGIRMHPLASVEFLKARGVSDEVWLATVLEHHEKSDGTGYPFGTTDVSLTAELVSIADIFCAKISSRGYRTPVTPSQAARELLVHQGPIKDQWLATMIIQEVGVSPPGSFVKLASGEVGLVVQRGRTAVSPIVKVLVDEKNKLLTQFHKRDTSIKQFAVVSVVPREKIKQLPPDMDFLPLISQTSF